MGCIFNINAPNINCINPPKIIIDTNILIDVFYSNPLKNTNYRERQYQNYINNCIQKKIPLYTTGINIYETFHVIDNINREIYNKKNGKELSLKEYHKLTTEVKKVHLECDMVYKSLLPIIKIIPHTTTNMYMENYLDKSDSCMDLYDMVLLKIAEEENFTYILTHDADFISNPSYIQNFNILTQNNSMLNAS